LRARPPAPWQPTYRLHRAVQRADSAVKLAVRTGAPTGELAGLTRQLIAKTDIVEQAYRLHPQQTASSSGFAAQVNDLLTTAATIHAAALAATHATNQPHVEDLVITSAQEHKALAAGLVHLAPPQN
jgi:hypothetical protein